MAFELEPLAESDLVSSYEWLGIGGAQYPAFACGAASRV